LIKVLLDTYDGSGDGLIEALRDAVMVELKNNGGTRGGIINSFA